MKTLNEIFASTKTTEECQKVFSLLLETDDVVVNFNCDNNLFNVYINYSIEIRQDLSGVIIAYRQEFGVGDPYMLFEVERHLIEVYFAIVELFSITPEFDDAGDEPMNEVSVCCSFNDLSIDCLREFLEVASVIDSIFLSKYAINIQPIENSKYYPIIDKIHRNCLNDLSLSNLCLLKKDFISIEIIMILIGSGFESSESTLSIFSPYRFIDSYNSIDFGLFEEHINENNVKDWERIKLCVELRNIIVLESQNRLILVDKTGYSIIEKLKSLCYVYGADPTEFLISPDYELLIRNSVFFTRQKAYMTDIEYGKKLVSQELEELKKSIPKISLEPFIAIEDITNRFQELIDSSDTKEQQLQTYLEKHFQILFGKKYDKCHPQVRIFRDSYDRKSDERRLDIALHDSVRNDWEIIELKKSNILLTRKVRKIPVFKSAVTSGIAQLRYYKEMLQQDKIREELRTNYQMNLEVPHYTLVIGKSLTEEIKKCIDQVQDITIKTYDQLMKEAELTFNDK